MAIKNSPSHYDVMVNCFFTRTLKVALRKLAIIALTLLLVVSSCSRLLASQAIKLSDAANGITLLERDQSGLTLKVFLGSLSVDEVNTKAGNFTLLAGQGFDHSSRIGEPSLPVANQLLAIPLGCDLSVEVISSEVQEISLADYGEGNRLLPVQPSLSKSQNPDEVPFEFRQDVYDRCGYYQLPAASTEAVGIMRGVRVGWISVAPVQYNAAENRIRVCKEMTIRVTFNNADWDATSNLYSKSYSPAFEPAYEMLMNSDARTFGLRNDLTSYPLTLVIVSARMFEAQLQPFIAWKIKKGFRVIVGYTDVVGSTTAAIKTYLQGLYNTEYPKPSFVLFVGDTPQIPVWRGTTGSRITDLRYCEYTGDNLPEVYYGRFSAQTTDELQPQIDKTLEYEQYTMPDPSYLGNSIMIAGVDGFFASTYGNGQINYGTNQYFNAAHGITPHVWLYPASKDAGAEAAIIAQVNQGSGFSNYTAHCDHEGWFSPSFVVSDVNGLTNAHKYGLAVGNCCISNTYGDSTPCFGEAWMQKANGGGIGYIGASDNSYWDEDYWWGVGGGKAIVAAGPEYDASKLGAYDGAFHGHGEPANQQYVTNFAMNMCGLLAVEQSSSLVKADYWEMYCLMGDPSVSSYLRVPLANSVSHSPSMLMTSTTFTVSADPGSYVALSTGGILRGAGLVPSGGTLDLPVTAFGALCTADLVVTDQNLVPYTTTIQVIAPFGDADNSGAIDISDAVYLIAYIFSGGSAPIPLEAGDANCDGACDVSDVVFLIAYIFSGGEAPCTK
ncbi:MAG: C25 family cysteine peptidase [candidate division Zixibacteria bacterium]|nr:C25 family cysteine peptidase [candidate division Zixibacteria bacterium]